MHTDVTMRVVPDAPPPQARGATTNSATRDDPATQDDPAPQDDSTPQGDPATRMTALFDAAYADLVRFVRARAASRVDDVVAEVFLTAWRRFDAVPTELDGARAWLFTTARYVLLNDARRAASDALPLLIEVAQLPPDDDVAARLDMAAALRALDAADQEALGLSVVDGLSNAEAAKVLGIGINAYAARLSRARRRLRARLGPTPDDRKGVQR